MRGLAELNRAAYVHVVQPNQFYSKHSFSPRERSIALVVSADHEYRVGTERGYRVLEEHRAVLEANGIVSALDLFDAEPEEVYVDACCHYTRKGLELFTQFVVGQIAQRIK
jgi:hypothetical protein